VLGSGFWVPLQGRSRSIFGGGTMPSGMRGLVRLMFSRVSLSCLAGLCCLVCDGASAPVQDLSGFLFSAPGSARTVTCGNVELAGAVGQFPGDYLTISSKWTGAFAVTGGVECGNVAEIWTVIGLDFDVVVEKESIDRFGGSQIEEVTSLQLHHNCYADGAIDRFALSADAAIVEAYQESIPCCATLEQIVAFKEIRSAKAMMLRPEDGGSRVRVKVRVRSHIAVRGTFVHRCTPYASCPSPFPCSDWSDWGYSDWVAISFGERPAPPFTLKFFFSPSRHEGDERSDLDSMKEVAGTWEDLAGLSEDVVLRKVYVDLLDDYFEMRELSGDLSLGAELPCRATTHHWGESIHDAETNAGITLTYVIECEGVWRDTDYAWVFYYHHDGALYRDTLRVRVDSAGLLRFGDWLEENVAVRPTESPVRTLEGHADRVSSVTFSPDGKLLASGSDDKTIKLWNVATGAVVRTLVGHSESVTSVAFSPDGSLLASGSTDSTVRMWEVATDTVRILSDAERGGIYTVAFSSDGKLLASGSWSGSVMLWDVATRNGEQLHGQCGNVWSVVFSPDCKLLAEAGVGAGAMLYDIPSGEARAFFAGHTTWASLNCVAFSPEGELLAGGSEDQTISLWDVSTGAVVRTLEGHRGPVNSIVFSPDGKLLASGSVDYMVKLWDVSGAT